MVHFPVTRDIIYICILDMKVAGVKCKDEVGEIESDILCMQLVRVTQRAFLGQWRKHGTLVDITDDLCGACAQ